MTFGKELDVLNILHFTNGNLPWMANSGSTAMDGGFEPTCPLSVTDIRIFSTSYDWTTGNCRHPPLFR